jgi:prepilin-type N-terminal cleavage/methylation domain-containing protein
MTATRVRRGVTLVELLVAMAMSATVLGGAVAAIGISGRTFRSATNGIQSSNAIDGLAQVSADVQLALDFTERTATATAFWVPDRTGDGAPELIRYAWSGTPGDPLTYSLNGSAAVEIVPSVNALSFGYIVTTVAGQATFVSPQGAGTSGEGEGRENEQLVFERAFSGTPAAVHTVTSSASVAAIVRPTLPGGGTRFQVTRVLIPMRKPAVGQNIIVAVHRVNGVTAVPEPTGLVWTRVNESDLPTSYADVEVVFGDGAVFAAGDHVAVVVSSDSSSASVEVPLEASPQYFTDGWIAARNVLGVWAVNATRDMPIAIYAEIDPEGG